MRIILASQSKRRIEIMEEMGFNFEVIPSKKDELVSSYSSSADLVMQLARQKGEDIYKDNTDAIVLGFDTLVFLGDEPLGKPHSEEECINMIEKLSGKVHKVVTGGYIKAKDYTDNFYSECLVKFKEIPEDAIKAYAKTSEPYDKAGGYAVQGYIGRYIESVNGDIFSVIGLPKAMTYEKLISYIKKH